jgi:hypothetical protein
LLLFRSGSAGTTAAGRPPRKSSSRRSAAPSQPPGFSCTTRDGDGHVTRGEQSADGATRNDATHDEPPAPTTRKE